MTVEREKEPYVPGPTTEQDRQYLVMMYEEHAEHARQHETLRAAVTGFFIALIAGLLAVVAADKHQQLVGAAICAISVLGLILNVKHYEKYRMHVVILSGFRKSLEKGLSFGIKDINGRWREYYKENEERMNIIRLKDLWIVVYFMTFLVGYALFVGALAI